MVIPHFPKIIHILFWVIVGLLLLLLAGNRAFSQIRDTRQIAARTEMKNIASALNMAKVDTGYHVTLRALDDEPGSGNYKIGTITQYKIQSEPLPFAINDNGSLLQTTNFPYSRWKGPYVTYQSICSTGNSTQLSQYGSPLDPWGHPYRFYTSTTLTNPSPGDPTISPFGQSALVSYGPDGLPGTNGQTQVGTGDDIVYRF